MTTRRGTGVNHRKQPENPAPGADEHFDRAMRTLHAQALLRVSASTHARLRIARSAAVAPRAPVRGFGWALASGLAAIFALAIGLQWNGALPTSGPPEVVAGPASGSDDGYDDAVDTLGENPDLYLWLASNDDTLPADWER